MENGLQAILYKVTEQLLGYLPNLVAGIVLIAVGWLLGWLAKRMVVQTCVVLRPDRLLRRFQWGTAFAKADVRHAFFDSIGNFAFFVVFLILLNASLDALHLTALSAVLEQGVLLIPRLLTALVILGLGWMAAGWVARGIQRALLKEEVQRATLIARFAKSVIVLFFAAMALTEINIAREIVVIGFSVAMVTLGVLTIVVTALSGRALSAKIMDHLEK